MRTGKYHVVGAVETWTRWPWLPRSRTLILIIYGHGCELNSLSVKTQEPGRVARNKPIDRLICNAGVYQPSLPYAKWSAGAREQAGADGMSHFLMISLLMPDAVARATRASFSWVR